MGEGESGTIIVSGSGFGEGDRRRAIRGICRCTAAGGYIGGGGWWRVEERGGRDVIS
jgi:hypothetical protein